jgi:pantoate--beta-alanine ligase
MLFESHRNLRNYLQNKVDSSHSIGFVPTMGALHDGHIALMDRALQENDFLVVSIFVNPTQFNNPADLEKYPRILDQDRKLMASRLESGKYIIYAPATEDVYGEHTASKSYDFGGLENVMEGAQRPGHFNGVGTILEFLFRVVQPDRAYFGEKDFQQLQIIKNLVRFLNSDIEILGCPIHREESGLAMSSRNGRLSAGGFKTAAHIYQVLQNAKVYFKSHSILETIQLVKREIGAIPGFELEYFTIAEEENLLPAYSKNADRNYRGFIVVDLEGVRLIDNIPFY